jgi:hypothetical protein
MNSKRNYTMILVSIAGILNIIGMILIIMPVVVLTPITLIFSAVLGGGLVILSIIIYAAIVTRDLINRGIL